MFSMTSSSSHCVKGMTHAGFPENTFEVKASTWYKSNSMKARYKSTPSYPCNDETSQLRFVRRSINGGPDMGGVTHVGPARRHGIGAVCCGLMLMWWMLEAVPLGVTSLLPLVLFPTLGVTGVAEAAAPYVDRNTCSCSWVDFSLPLPLNGGIFTSALR